MSPSIRPEHPTPRAKTRCGPEFAAQAYLACTKGVADARQQRSVAAQLAVARSDRAEMVAAAQLGLALALIKYGNLDPEVNISFDFIREAIAKATA